MPERDFWVVVTGPRAADFEAVFATARVPVRSPIPHWARLPGQTESVLVYELDLTWVRGETRQRLVAHLAQRFGYSEAEVVANLEREGMPILASETVAAWKGEGA